MFECKRFDRRFYRFAAGERVALGDFNIVSQTTSSGSLNNSFLRVNYVIAFMNNASRSLALSMLFRAALQSLELFKTRLLFYHDCFDRISQRFPSKKAYFDWILTSLSSLNKYLHFIQKTEINAYCLILICYTIHST